ncbi:hypothetical protein H0H93_010617, partial [Arthromyces matolae]
MTLIFSALAIITDHDRQQKYKYLTHTITAASNGRLPRSSSIALSMAFPLPNVLYRIQSVDFDTCLELYDIDNEAVILRNTKDTELQQWTFRKQKSGDAYQILAAATLASSTPRYFILPEVGDESQPRPLAPPKAVIRATTFNWNIFKESDGSYIITTKVGNMNHPGYLRVSEDGKPSLRPNFADSRLQPDSVEKQARGSKLADRSLRWRITEFDSVEPCSSLSRYPEIKEGDHAMRNLGTGHYWGFIAPSKNPHVTPVQIKEVKARFFYVDEGNTFKIGYLNSDWYILVDR